MARPSGSPPPAAATLSDGEVVALEPLASEICRRYYLEYPDEERRYGEDGIAWCMHDNQWIVAWAIADLGFGGQLTRNLAWLADLLASRAFPLDRLARDVEIAAEVVAEALPHRAGAVAAAFASGAELVRELARGERPRPRPEGAELREAYVASLLSGDPGGARRLIETAVEQGLPARAAYLDVLQPALYEIGERWASGRASVAQEHLATATTQILLARLAPELERPPPVGRRIVVAVTQGELHAVGSRFVADFLAGDGWTVLELGAWSPVEDLVAFVRSQEPDVVALSTTLTTNLPAAETTLHRLRALSEPPLLAAGGRAYGGAEELARRLGADVYAGDAGTLSDLLRKAFARGQ